MSREINPFGLRMPPALRARLEANAAASGRSLNAEIVYLLERSLEGSTQLGEVANRNDRLLREIVRVQELIAGLDAKFAADRQALIDSAAPIYHKRREQSETAVSKSSRTPVPKKASTHKAQTRARK